jgi:predicted ArsR family transcriptional regulator
MIPWKQLLLDSESTMSTAAPSTDADLLELLRSKGALDVTEMAKSAEVTATAIRQRLGRLLAQGLIQRNAIRAGRGRPRHRYRLTQKGMRLTGSNFTDLALALWHEVRSIPDAEVRRGLLRRVVAGLAAAYGPQIEGRTPEERMRSLTDLLSQRRVVFTVDPAASPYDLPLLTAHACPYPELAEQDRGICILEKMLFSEIIGQNLELAQCRLDGGSCCQFQPS